MARELAASGWGAVVSTDWETAAFTGPQVAHSDWADPAPSTD